MNLLAQPELVLSDPVLAFRTALWFWMTPRAPKPSCHSVMTGAWQPNAQDVQLGRLPGYGMTTNIINGVQECGASSGNPGVEGRVFGRIFYFRRYASLLGATTGEHLECWSMTSYAA